MDTLTTLLLAYVAGSLLAPRMPKGTFYLGTETPYVYEPTTYTSPPEGYTPFFINHLGRHGGRYLASPNHLKHFYDTLLDADTKSGLTAEGQQLRKQIQLLMEVEDGKYGMLTPLGKEMEAGIAKRMYEAFPEVFGRKVEAVSTYVDRAKESMQTFLETLADYTSPRQFHASVNGKVDPVLRFFDLNEAYEKYKKQGKWQEEVAYFEKRKNDARSVLMPFFTQAYLEGLENIQALATDLYTFYTNEANIEVPVGLETYFTEDQLLYFWENANLRHYLEQGPSNKGQHLPTDIAFALLGDFLVTTENAIASGDQSAYLRFAHAETIIPFASILKLKDFSKQTDDLNEVAAIWQGQKVAPMAANIWWVLYKHETTGNVLVKMLYNEKEIAFPFASPYGMYARWEDVRCFYTNILKGLHIQWQKGIIGAVKTYQVK